MANLRTVPRSEWTQFFDRVSKAPLLGKWAEIEVASLETEIRSSPSGCR